MMIDSRTASGKLIKTLLDNGPSHDYAGESLHEMKQRIQNSASTQRRTYLSLNLELITPEVNDKKSVVMKITTPHSAGCDQQVIGYASKLVDGPVSHQRNVYVIAVKSKQRLMPYSTARHLTMSDKHITLTLMKIFTQYLDLETFLIFVKKKSAYTLYIKIH